MAITLKQHRKYENELSSLDELKSTILSAAKAAAEAGRHDDLVVTLSNGWTDISEPFVLSAKENPELLSLDLTIRARNERDTVFGSLKLIDGKEFSSVEGTPYFTYQFPKDADGKYPLFHDLYLNGIHVPSAKSPVWRNPIAFTPEERAGDAKVTGFYVPYEIAKTLKDGAMGATELMMYIEWEFAILHVTGVDLANRKVIEGVPHVLVTVRQSELDFLATSCHRSLNVGNRETFFQNAPAFLTPGTYAYDYENGIIYVYPKEGAVTKVHYPTLENLFIFEGLENLTLYGLNFTATTSKHVCRDIYYSGQANTLYGAGKLDDCARGRLRHAAIVTSNMRNFTLENCKFIDLGGNGVLMTNNTTIARLRGNLFKNVAMSAISIGNPTTAWEEIENRNVNITVENNYFNHIAYEYPTALCIYVGIVDTLSITRNTVEGCGYSAVSVGWGWSYVPYMPGEKVNVRDADISFNRFHNFMDVLRDGAAIYVVGANCHKCYDRRFNVMHDNFASLDERRDSSKRGYYCDGSTSNWEVRHSVILNCALPLFSQFHWLPAGTHHVTMHDVYSTTPIDKGNHAPDRDTLVEGNFVVEEGEEALYAAYPVARDIRDASGCDAALTLLV